MNGEAHAAHYNDNNNVLIIIDRFGIRSVRQQLKVWKLSTKLRAVLRVRSNLAGRVGSGQVGSGQVGSG